ncbi:MAG: thrombospondin type 3 repeat-containing protein [Myxococcota bacterium]
MDDLAGLGMLTDWNIYDAGGATPLDAELAQYDAVLLVADDQGFLDPILLGDRLAGFVDQGGGVVMVGAALGNATGVAGDFLDVTPVLPGPIEVIGAPSVARQAVGFQWKQAVGGFEVGHPTVYGFNRFSEGSGTTRLANPVVATGALVAAVYDDGAAAVIVRPEVGQSGRVVALNVFPYATDRDPRGWTGDGHRLIVESLLWAGGYSRPANTAQNTTAGLDFDCDGTDSALQALVDPDAPIYGAWLDTDGNGTNETREVLGTCADRVDPITNAPLTSTDFFFDTTSHGCTYLLSGLDELDSALHVEGPGDGRLGPDPAGSTVTDPFTGLVRPVASVEVFGPNGTLDQQAVLECDNCPLHFNPDQYDIDGDDIGDLCDVCPFLPNTASTDSDGDGIGDACDNCIDVQNAVQRDTDGDGFGDACDVCLNDFEMALRDEDRCGFDGPDGFPDACDNCPDDCNKTQSDIDLDGVGDVCDNCPQTPNPDQYDNDLDGYGNACDPCPRDSALTPDNAVDSDLDGVGDPCDVCPSEPNPKQLDTDRDGRGDVCDRCPIVFSPSDADEDADGIGDACDNCPNDANEDQQDDDGDGIGNACDLCPTVLNVTEDTDLDGYPDDCDTCPFLPSPDNADVDGDGVGDICDNCPATANPGQRDRDGNLVGDVCEAPTGPGCGAAGCGGCSGMGGGPSPVAWFVVAWVVGLRRSRK